MGSAGYLFGHEAQLDEGAHAGLQQTIVNLVHVGKIVDGFSGGVFVVNAYFVVEDCVEADVFEICGGFYFAQVIAIALAEGEDRAAGAEHLFPEVGEGLTRGAWVWLDCLGRGVRI